MTSEARQAVFYGIQSLLLSLVLAFSIYWFFFNKYGEGERKGTLIKITHKGNIFKTDEGEMWLSCRQTMNPEKFYFSVTNDSIAVVLKNLQDECVQVIVCAIQGFFAMERRQ